MGNVVDCTCFSSSLLALLHGDTCPCTFEKPRNQNLNDAKLDLEKMVSKIKRIAIEDYGKYIIFFQCRWSTVGWQKEPNLVQEAKKTVLVSIDRKRGEIRCIRLGEMVMVANRFSAEGATLRSSH